MRGLRLPTRSETVAAALTLAATAMVIGIGVHVYRLTSDFPPWPPFSFARNVGYARPVALFLLTVIVILRRSRSLNVILFFAALAQIPYMGGPLGDGILDVPVIIKIRFGELVHTSAAMFDLSALLFLMSSVLLLITTCSSRTSVSDGYKSNGQSLKNRA